MRYAVTVETGPPASTAPLDPLQSTGVAALLDGVVSRAHQAIGPDGALITVLDRWVGTHPEGAIVALVVDAPNPQAASDAVTALIRHTLTSQPALAGWAITDTSTALACGGQPRHPARPARTSRAAPATHVADRPGGAVT